MKFTLGEIISIAVFCIVGFICGYFAGQFVSVDVSIALLEHKQELVSIREQLDILTRCQ